ncbi:DUF5060 domain-containing protein [Paenibacillus tarimensis]
MTDDHVEQWGIFELALEGPPEGNPFAEVELCARFEKGQHVYEAEGYYDGNGMYRIRFMPNEQGDWSYITSSNRPELDGMKGQFRCTAPSAGNRGPVRVKGGPHFRYEDGTQYIPIGTTCLVWHLQDETRQRQTLRTLESSPFNKIRMYILPKAGLSGGILPGGYPFEGSPEQGFDYSRYRPEYFAFLEKRIRDLMALGIEADLILFHPDEESGWGFDAMSPEEDERYVRYVVARLAAFRNVWWSLADGYDSMMKKTGHWDRMFRIVQECDYGGHLRSILNDRTWYDFGKPWITHASIRHADEKVASDCTRQYGKPVIIDDCGCEGNLESRWESYTPEDMLCKVWEGVCRGGYVTHGEAYLHPQDVLWRSQGGELHGGTVPGIAFMRGILEEAPEGIAYNSDRYDAATLEIRGEYYLQYFGPHRFAYRELQLPEGKYKVDVIDTWNRTISPLEELFEGRFRVELPAKPYYAIRIRKVSEEAGGAETAQGEMC